MNKLLLTALLLLSFSANAAEWIDLGKSKDKQNLYFMDFDSVQKRNIHVIGGSNNYVSAVIQDTYINNNPTRKKGVYYSKEQWFVSCKDKSFLLNSYIDYGFKDEVIQSNRLYNSTLRESDFSYAFPDTVGEVAVDAICLAALIKGIDIDTDYYNDFL